MQQIKFTPAELERDSVERRLVRLAIQPQAADLDRLRPWVAAARHPAEHGPYSCVDLPWPERLDQVIIGPCVTRCRHHDRDIADRAHHPQRFVAIETGQPQIEDDQIRRRVDDVLERIERRCRARHDVATLRECPDKGLADRWVIFDQQKLCHIADGSRRARTMRRFSGGWLACCGGESDGLSVSLPALNALATSMAW